MRRKVRKKNMKDMNKYNENKIIFKIFFVYDL